ncbi:MAG: hypothetical protein RIT27_680 [Pseudomonadota bacterium]|jgi:asparagine synthase (glutamine-hydrolysing)
MCGVCGIWHYQSEKTVDPQTIEVMKQRLEKRGPDDQGTYLDGALGLGFRRLAIIDLSGGHQPMTNAQKDLWLVFNGEIYNHESLREELKSRGCQFRTRSDTEVLLYAYQEFGEECVHKLRGMFAFVVWDSKKQQLFAARDRLGIKPFYFYDDGETFVFASELKALREGLPKKLDLNLFSLERFLTYRYVPGPETMWKGVSKLQPGHRLIKTKNKQLIESYWKPSFEDYNTTISTEQYLEQLERILFETVKLHLDADVPLGVLLSGGLDSSTILAFAKAQSNSIKAAFSIGFKQGGEFDETHYAKQVAEHFGIEHVILKIDEQDFLNGLQDFIWFQDEPLADPTGLPLYLICQEAKKSVTVLLSGEGADEIFTGYDRYKIAPFLNWNLQLFQGISKMFSSGSYKSRFLGALTEKNMAAKWQAVSSLTSLDMRKNLLMPDIDFKQANEAFLEDLQKQLAGIQNPINQMQMMDRNMWLPENMLTKKDRMTMAASIEARVPFLDHVLVEFGLKLPPSLRLHHFTGKWAVRQIVKNKLPENITNRRKTGWPIPLGTWFRNQMKSLSYDVLLGEQSRQRGLFSPSALEKILEEHNKQTVDHGRLIFLLLCMEMWLQQYA